MPNCFSWPLPSDAELTDAVKTSAVDTLATRISNRLNKHE